MPTIDELVNEETKEEMQDTELEVYTPQERQGIDLSLLKAETGEGEIEDYLSHPLNFNNQKSTARVLRGLTGMFGSLRYAMIDIVIGVLEFSKSKKVSNPS